jgi:hypothetical protein
MTDLRERDPWAQLPFLPGARLEMEEYGGECLERQVVPAFSMHEFGVSSKLVGGRKSSVGQSVAIVAEVQKDTNGCGSRKDEPSCTLPSEI